MVTDDDDVLQSVVHQSIRHNERFITDDYLTYDSLTVSLISHTLSQ